MYNSQSQLQLAGWLAGWLAARTLLAFEPSTQIENRAVVKLKITRVSEFGAAVHHAFDLAHAPAHLFVNSIYAVISLSVSFR